MALDGTDGDNNSRSAMRPPMNRKVVVIPLCIKRQFSTAGAPAGRDYLVGPAKLTGIGPSIEDIVGQARGENFTTNFNWKLLAEKSSDGEGWAAFTNRPLNPNEPAARRGPVGPRPCGPLRSRRLPASPLRWQ